MSLLGPFDRPVALRLSGSWHGSPPRPSTAHPASRFIAPAPGSPKVTAANIEVARFLVKTLFADTRTVGEVVAKLEAAVDEQVVTWSPAFYTTSRTELVAALLDGDDAVTDVEISIDGEGLGGSAVYVLWSLTGRFGNAGLLNDDVLVEPSHAAVESAGVMVVAFKGSRVVRIDCFYDGVSLLEQVLTGQPSGDVSEPA